ncbi:uncharacterized protein LOC107416550 [Ziziphus jujuba]|uniref:Uncharacterized protein LOC107416550 n=1 Tax=Ziziphus jujuba TaxID=326968 RepID=A0ABM3II05_ZIZJJ|nr:uncharacterized protein LOC107416550 [Ziziphus jujuba]XP_048328839.2 uncharacterized protein LOC107416550 [Ziziphus jujuba]XP_048328840.2 uncharacterized protein LOC107416550 [Ziziphus jujuba]XP_048328841.2 uncharacterized protein LOC107416550 [Ziziphus jujuba]
MVVVQASKLDLPNPSLSSPHITSLLFEPHSLSLALMHSDSSFSLYPSISPFSLSSLPPPQTIVSPPSSSATFLLLQNPNPNNPDTNSRVLFVVSGPYGGGSKVLLRFYILQRQKLFTKAQVVCNQRDLQFDGRLGVLIDCNHGVSIRLSGSVNFFAMYSVSSSKVWVFAVKSVVGSIDDDDGGGGGGGDGVVVKLMRCAVIECCNPLWSISVSFGFLILGELNGVRVFNLRPIVKGQVRKVKPWHSNSKPEGRKSCLPNGVIGGDDVYGDLRGNMNSGGSGGCGKSDAVLGISEIACNGYLEGKKSPQYVSVKQRAIKLRADSCEQGACFVALKRQDAEPSKSKVVMSVKAISIQALSAKKFIILDSAGNLHLLRLSYPVVGSDITCDMRQLPQVLKVQNLAIIPDTSLRTQTVWVSDGYHSVHMMVASDMENLADENDRSENKEKLMQISAVQAFFASEKIQDVIPLAANAIFLLGQGSLYAYAVS